MLNLLRWADEVRDVAGLAWPGEDVKVSAAELKMAEQLVDAMAGEWQPDLFHDEFREKLMELVERKQREGGLRTVAPLPGEDVPASAEVIDLTELLRRSLKGDPAAPAAKKGSARREEAANDAPAPAPARKAAARKSPATARASARPATRRKSG